MKISATTGYVQITNLPYGMSVDLARARLIIAGAQDEARKKNWNMAIAVVDTGGHLVALERMDDTQYASPEVAIKKAQTAVGFRRPSKALQDVVTAGGEGLRMLVMPGALPIDGGVPLVLDGKIIGAVGVSGGSSAQDGQVAYAGAATVKSTTVTQ